MFKDLYVFFLMIGYIYFYDVLHFFFYVSDQAVNDVLPF